MRDKFVFSNSQDLGSLNSTGVTSTNYFDLEYDSAENLIVADQQAMCWLHILILSTTNTGGADGLDITFLSSDNPTTGASPIWLGTIKLTQAEILATTAKCPAEFCIGVCKANLKRYLYNWYKAINASLNGATIVDCWIDDTPSSERNIQKKPA